MNADSLENMLIKFNKKEIIDYLMLNELLQKEQIYMSCNKSMRLVIFNNIADGYIFRCFYVTCTDYLKRTSIRKNSFFENINLDFIKIFKVVLRWAINQLRHSIKLNININQLIVQKILNKLLSKIGNIDFSVNKLGGNRKIAQINETMLNYKCKSHRGRSSNNKTDALCIVEFDGQITRCFATVINDKKSRNPHPII